LLIIEMDALPNSLTVLTGLFGYPVEHSISPVIHNSAFSHARMDWTYLAFSVKPENLEEAFIGFQALGGRGLNITIPHKQEVIRLLDEVSEEASLIGAVNTVLFRDGRSLGYNTDGPGFVRTLKEEKDFLLDGMRVCLIGAGGAGRAVAVQSALSGIARIDIADLDSDRVEELSGWINQEIRADLSGIFRVGSREGDEIIAAADLVVDATPLGLNPDDPLSFDPSLLNPGGLVMDLVYNPPETELLNAARDLGIDTLNGLGMLIHQAALAWEIWTGERASIEVMKKAARAALYKSGIKKI
jgi:shikimate dehydrogenase